MAASIASSQPSDSAKNARVTNYDAQIAQFKSEAIEFTEEKSN